MAVIGFLEFDPENSDDLVFLEWPDARDVDPDQLLHLLKRGHETVLDMIPENQLKEPTLGNLSRWANGQILAARYHWVRVKAGNADTYGADPALQFDDPSRKIWLDLRSLIRPRRGFRGVR